MEEKIKIYIGRRTRDILYKDMELFEFFKSGMVLNKNDFLNTLLANYFEAYQEAGNARYAAMKAKLREAGLKEHTAGEVADEIMHMTKYSRNDPDGKYDVTMSLKPTKKTSDIIAYIQSTLLAHTSLSQYFRDLFEAYTAMPQDEREKIIFRDSYEKIRQAIAEDRMIYFINRTTSRKIEHTVSPYSVASAKEELFNYVLCQQDGLPFTIRLSRISGVILLNRKRELARENVACLKRMEQYGPQFLILQDREICIRLSEEGIRQYQYRYVHRPETSRIEGNLYYFNCSENQVMQYFSRFGRHAVIVYPEDLAEQMLVFHSSARKAYQKELEKKEKPE